MQDTNPGSRPAPEPRLDGTGRDAPNPSYAGAFSDCLFHRRALYRCRLLEDRRNDVGGFFDVAAVRRTCHGRPGRARGTLSTFSATG